MVPSEFPSDHFSSPLNVASSSSACRMGLSRSSGALIWSVVSCSVPDKCVVSGLYPWYSSHCPVTTSLSRHNRSTISVPTTSPASSMYRASEKTTVSQVWDSVSCSRFVSCSSFAIAHAPRSIVAMTRIGNHTYTNRTRLMARKFPPPCTPSLSVVECMCQFGRRDSQTPSDSSGGVVLVR